MVFSNVGMFYQSLCQAISEHKDWNIPTLDYNFIIRLTFATLKHMIG